MWNSFVKMWFIRNIPYFKRRWRRREWKKRNIVYSTCSCVCIRNNISRKNIQKNRDSRFKGKRISYLHIWSCFLIEACIYMYMYTYTYIFPFFFFFTLRSYFLLHTFHDSYSFSSRVRSKWEYTIRQWRGKFFWVRPIS